MNSRQSITEIFSTFIQFSDDQFSGWMTDPRLRRSMVRCLEQMAASAANASEQFWVLYWHRLWQTQPQSLAVGHLSAYLQESCYWVAYRATSNLTSVQAKPSDYFQIAIANLPDVLQGYRSDRGASLKTYASIIFNNTIRDRLRQQREADSRTDWGLLRKVSQKRLVEALQMAGFADEAIARYRLAWTCFKTFCAPSETPSTRQLARPDATQWAATAELYNSQRRQQLPANAPEANPDSLERWLKDCAKQVRAYLYPPTVSLNLSRSEPGSSEIQDFIPDEANASPLATLISQEELQERQAQQTQVSDVLATALTKLDPQVQTLLELYYGQGSTQQQIAAALDLKQYTISRRLSSTKEALLLTLARWSQDTLHISLTSTAVKHMSIVLEEWLQAHYQKAAAGSSKDVSCDADI